MRSHRIALFVTRMFLIGLEEDRVLLGLAKFEYGSRSERRFDLCNRCQIEEFAAREARLGARAVAERHLAAAFVLVAL